jgi:hypothetical protein
MSFITVLPRDIFTAAMIGNDYMLVFFAILSFYLFLKTIIALKNGIKVWKCLILLVITAALGSLTKQHGLLLQIFPLSVFLLLIIKSHRNILLWAIPILLLGGLLSISDEAWKINKTGKFLVSNQDHFDYAKNQFPGSLDKVEFFSFRIFELYKEPFISERTSASFFTELFARTFYDYEWRFISPKIPLAKALGFLAYSLGIIWLLFFSLILFTLVKRLRAKSIKLDFYKLISITSPLIVGIMFAFVPFIQTLRYPYFSSMKSMFMLSGLILTIISLGSQIKQGSLTQKIGIYIIFLNLFFGVLLVSIISYYLDISLNHLHGPLWHLP